MAGVDVVVVSVREETQFDISVALPLSDKKLVDSLTNFVMFL